MISPVSKTGHEGKIVISTEATHSLIVSRAAEKFASLHHHRPAYCLNTVAGSREWKYKKKFPHHIVLFTHLIGGIGQPESFDSSNERNSPWFLE
jgi:hypothetical protein